MYSQRPGPVRDVKIPCHHGEERRPQLKKVLGSPRQGDPHTNNTVPGQALQQTGLYNFKIRVGLWRWATLYDTERDKKKPVKTKNNCVTHFNEMRGLKVEQYMCLFIYASFKDWYKCISLLKNPCGRLLCSVMVQWECREAERDLWRLELIINIMLLHTASLRRYIIEASLRPELSQVLHSAGQPLNSCTRG